MSEAKGTTSSAAEVGYDLAFQVGQVVRHAEQLPFGEGVRLDLSKTESIELSTVESPAGLSAFVVRQRHNLGIVNNGVREDVYFALRPDVIDRPVQYLRDDLDMEGVWMESGDFDKILPRRDSLAKKAAFGDIFPDVNEATYENVVELSRLLHAAAAVLRHAA